jgi:hypothetical protein
MPRARTHLSPDPICPQTLLDPSDHPRLVRTAVHQELAGLDLAQLEEASLVAKRAADGGLDLSPFLTARCSVNRCLLPSPLDRLG